MRAGVVALALALTACGGPSTSAPTDSTPGGGGGGDTVEPSPEERLRMVQDQECGRMCPSLTACAVIEGKANPDLTDEERSAFEDPQTLDTNTNMCLEACGASELSPRQVKVLRECNEAMPPTGEPNADQCAGYLACLEQVSAE